jgi:hypothetical protein
MRFRVAVFGALAVLLGALAYGWVAWAHPRIVAARQVRNWVELQAYVQLLENFRALHGAYPSSLALAVPEQVAHRDSLLLARDVYGRSLHYESDGVQYLLSSYGRDGVRDVRPYSNQRGASGVDNTPCYDDAVDTAYSSDGVRQLCGK